MQQEANNKNRDFQSLFEIAANRMGIGTEFHAIKICHDARKYLDKCFPDYQQEYRVASFKTGCLTITTKNPAVSQQIQIKSHMLQQELNQTLGENTITKVRVKAN
jgi:hypothetical protein